MVASLKYIILVLVLGIFSGIIVCQENHFAMQREKMVNNQIVARGISHKATIKAMETVPRHLFVPESLQDNAYADRPLSIGYGQTISQPYIVAYMTAILDPEDGDKVLEVGTGSGYQAAVLSEIVDSVFTIEIVDELAAMVDIKFKELGYRNILVKAGDGYFGWGEHAPFDKIIVTAAAEEIPPMLIDQLIEGGKMIIPVGPEFSVQYLVLIKKEDGKIKKYNKLPVRFVPFTREEKQ